MIVPFKNNPLSIAGVQPEAVSYAIAVSESARLPQAVAENRPGLIGAPYQEIH